MVKTNILSNVSLDKDSIEYKNKLAVKKHKFIKFISHKINKILRICHVRFENNPLSFRDYDRRMSIGVSLAHTFEDNFNEFQRVENEHYDLTFNKVLNISLKAQSELFQKKKINGDPSRPKSLVIKNGMSSSRTIVDDDWNYLIAIERQNSEKDIRIGLAIASFTTISQHISDSSTEQVKVKMKNSDWDYFIRASSFLDEYSDRERKMIDEAYLRREYENFYDDMTQNRISLNSL